MHDFTQTRALLAHYAPQVDADAVIASLDVFNEEVFRALPGLKLVSRWGVGFDAIDLEAATRHGVLVTNTPGVLDETVADLAFALILGIARKIPAGAASMLHGEWRPEWGVDVHSKTLGLVGCGRIGTAVARRALPDRRQAAGGSALPVNEGR